MSSFKGFIRRQALLTVWPNRQVTQKLKRHARRIGKSDHIGVQVGRIQVGAASTSSGIGYLDKVVNRRP
ncbi:hypothetical protein [Numidum massiliense]|uniref:hypothetical protein n=1 Tax=Numidum massiliense TaxID=1522315 RepID=UPI0011C76E8B|nr:hypothetical protein [Numidum massiliense]